MSKPGNIESGMVAGAIDAWAQPALGTSRADLPEAVRLFEKSGTAHLLDRRLSPEKTVAEMDSAGVAMFTLAADLLVAGSRDDHS
jgi:hypothetical protein